MFELSFVWLLLMLLLLPLLLSLMLLWLLLLRSLLFFVVVSVIRKVNGSRRAALADNACMASSSSLWRRRASGRAELGLLLDLARGNKSYEDVKTEAERFAFEAPILRNLIGSNTSRTIQRRLESLTGINKDSLCYFNIRRKSGSEDAPLLTKRHPFNLLTSMIKRRLQSDPNYFEVTQTIDQAGTVASSFVNSPEYTCHDLVQDCMARGEMVIPIGIYGDGIAVGVDVYQDSLYVVYIYFPHRGVSDCRKPGSKHTFTVYRKSEAAQETSFNDE